MFGAFRLTLAGLVVAQHLTGRDLPFFREAGYFAAIAFYMLSGFVITRSLNDVYQFDPRRFFANRLLRLLPSYYLVLILTALCAFVLPGQTADGYVRPFSFTIADTITNLFLLPGNAEIPGNFRAIPGSESLGFLLMDYILAWVFIARSWRHALGAVMISAILMFVPQAFPDFPWEPSWNLWNENVLAFAAGAVLSFASGRIPIRMAQTLTIIGPVVFVGWLLYVGASGITRAGSVAFGNVSGFCISLIMLGVTIVAFEARARGKFAALLARYIWQGKFAYSLFLSHGLVMYLMSAALGSIASPPLVVASTLPLILLASWGLTQAEARTFDALRDAIRRGIDPPLGRISSAFGTTLKYAVVATLVVSLVAGCWISLSWQMKIDSPFMHYQAWLIAGGRVAYRDLFSTDMPGSLAFHVLIGRLVGWSDVAFHWTDLALLAVMIAATYRLLRPFGRLSAIGAGGIFALTYLSVGPPMTLERDYVGLILVVIGLALAVENGIRRVPRLGLAGIAFGMAALIKPHLLIGAFPLAIFLIRDIHRENPTMAARAWRRVVIATVGIFVLGLMAPVSATAYYLFAHQALGPFLEGATQYLPLHLLLSGDHVAISGVERVLYIAGEMFAMGDPPRWFLLPAAVLGAMRMSRVYPARSRNLDLGWMLVGLAVVYWIYPAFAGQFFFYHWVPFAYFLTVLSLLAVAEAEQPISPYWTWAPQLMLLLTLAATQPSPVIASPIGEAGASTGREGIVDRLAKTLADKVKPGDTVQPLDWSDGAVHAMLIAKVPLATSFYLNYYFYHHVDTPIIRTLRARFVNQLRETRPRIIVDVFTGWRVSGPGTSTEFPELTAFASENYVATVCDDSFTVFERKDSVGPDTTIDLACKVGPPRTAGHYTRPCPREGLESNARGTCVPAKIGAAP